MNDGFHGYEPATWEAAGLGELRCAPTQRPEPWKQRDDALTRVADCLPRLGNVLWLYRDRSPSSPLPPCGEHGQLAIGHPAVAALHAATGMRAHSSVTSQGPREWLEFVDADGNVLAKLYLLPDTDFLAWDQMLANRTATPAAGEGSSWQAPLRYLRNAIGRVGSPWHALPLRFGRARLALDATIASSLSQVGRHLAATIADDERADWTGFPAA